MKRQTVQQAADVAADPPAPATPSLTRPRAGLWAFGRVALAAVAVATLGVVIAFGYELRGKITPTESTDNAYVRGDLTFVATKVPGYVVEVPTENNRRVSAGDVLARIDPGDFEAAVREAEAALAQQEAAGLQIEAQVDLQAAQISSADAALAAARADAVRTAADFARARELVESGTVSRAHYDLALSSYDRAAAGVSQAQAQGQVARRQLGVLDAQRGSNVAAQQGARAHLMKAQNDLASTVIRAPREGVVAARSVRVGEYAAMGSRLMAVAPTQSLWVEANLRETQLARIRPGDRVQVRVDAAPDHIFCGAVESLAGASNSELSVIPPDNATGNFTKIVRRFPVRILLDRGQAGLERLGVGMSAVTTIALVPSGSGISADCRRSPSSSHRSGQTT